MALVPQKEYAKQRGVSPQYINKLVRLGRIVLVAGAVDTEQANAALCVARPHCGGGRGRTKGDMLTGGVVTKGVRVNETDRLRLEVLQQRKVLAQQEVSVAKLKLQDAMRQEALVSVQFQGEIDRIAQRNGIRATFDGSRVILHQRYSKTRIVVGIDRNLAKQKTPKVGRRSVS